MCDSLLLWTLFWTFAFISRVEKTLLFSFILILIALSRPKLLALMKQDSVVMFRA